MPKKAITVTLEVDNLTWLKGRVRGGGLRSVSELLDRLVAAARGSGEIAGARSVVGSIDIDASDPWLEQADGAVRETFERSFGRPLAVRDAPPPYGTRRRPAKRQS